MSGNVAPNSIRNYGGEYRACRSSEGIKYVLYQKPTLDGLIMWSFWRVGEFYEGIDSAAFGSTSTVDYQLRCVNDPRFNHCTFFQFTSETELNKWING